MTPNPILGALLALVAAARFLWAILFATGLIGPALNGLATGADSPPAKILVVNSDGRVEKYNTAQKSFRDSFEHPVKELDLSGLSEQAAERAIRSESPTAVYTIGVKAAAAAGRSVPGKPMVVSSVINWHRLPSAKDPNTHVIANELPSAAQLTMFRYFFPRIRRVGVLYSRDFNRQWMADAVAAGTDVGIEVIGVPVRTGRAARTEAARLLAKVDALWVTADPVVLNNEADVRTLFEEAASARKPAFTYTSAFAVFNPTLIVAPDIATIGRQAAGILKGLADGSSKEVQNPAGSEMTLNLRAVREYGLELNTEAMDSVNQVIR
jgi:putative ABC transport system substrate-binding protein